MDTALTCEVDFNDRWLSGAGVSGWLCYEPKRVTVGQAVLAVDLYDDTLTAAATVVAVTTYVAFLLPTVILPAETSESSL